MILRPAVTQIWESMQQQYDRSIGLVESPSSTCNGNPVNVEYHGGRDATYVPLPYRRPGFYRIKLARYEGN